MTRDPLLPVRLVDGVWITEGAGSASVPTTDAPWQEPGVKVRNMRCFPDPVVFADVVLPPRPATDYARAFAEYNPPTSCEVTIPITVNADDWREFVKAHQDPITIEHNPATGETTVSFDAEATCPGGEPIPVRAVVTYTPPRRIFAAVALDGSGVHGIGAGLDSARAHALSTRDDGDPAWLDTLRAVTLSGEPAAVQALVEALSSPPAGGDVWEGT